MNKAFFLILTGAALWGTLSFFVKNLYEVGFTPMEVVTLRVWSAAFLLLLYRLFISRKSLRLHKITDLKYFIGTGIFSFILFNYCLFTAMEMSTIPVATSLLYTGPAFVTLLSFFLFKEPLTRIKVISLLITIFGTALVVGIIPFDGNVLSFMSIIIGIGAGFGYSLYSIFSKYALKTYDSLAVTTFTFTIAAITLTPFFSYQEKASLLFDPSILFYVSGLGLIPTAIAYILYTYGLQRTEASKASILSTIEPVIATIIGIFVFQETFSFFQILGMASIILAVILVQLFDNRAIYFRKIFQSHQS